MNNEKKRVPYFAVALIAGLMALVAILIAGSVIINGESVRRKNELEAGYVRAFYNLTDSVNNLEVNLSKLMVADGKAESVPIINDVNAQAEMAVMSLSDLPMDYGNVRKAAKYFNQVGDWCRTYAGAAAKGEDTSGFYEQAESLYIVAREMNAALRDLAIELGDGKIIESIGGDRLLGLDFDVSFGDMEENSIDYPELIYDGPFSDSKKFCFHALEGLDEITAERALARAEEVGLTDVKAVGRTEGKTDLFEIEGKAGGGYAHLSVTVKGGLIACYDRTKAVGAVKLNRAEASARAVEEAARLGYGGLTAIWYNAENGVGFVNLAPVEEGITYYTDLVKVKIALDDGTLLGLEATGYCSAHRRRDLCPVISESTVRALVGNRIDIERIGLAVIPDGDDERFCYEVYGSHKGLDYFIYFDAATGAQADVLRVIDSEQGSMIM